MKSDWWEWECEGESDDSWASVYTCLKSSPYYPIPPPPPPRSLCLLLLVLLLLFSFSLARCLCLSSACLLPRASLSVLAFYAPFFRFSVAARVAACEAYVHFYGLQRSPDCGTVGLTDGPTEGFYDFVMKFVRCKFDVASGCFSYLPSLPPPSLVSRPAFVAISVSVVGFFGTRSPVSCARPACV